MQYRYAIPMAITLILGATTSANAQRIELTLGEVLTKSRQHGTVAVAESDAERATIAANLERRQALLPTLALSASASVRDREFTLATPMGDLPIGATSTLQAQIQVTQPLLDATRLFYVAPAARLDAKAARFSARRTRDEAAAQAAEYFFAVLSYTAQQEANTSFVESLEKRLAEVQSMVDAERVVGADALRVRLALQDAQQRGLVLSEQKAVAKLALGHAIGLDEAVAAAPLHAEHQLYDTSATASRADLLALRTKRSAVEKRLGAVGSELIPKIVLQGALIHSNAGPQAEENFAQGTISLQWVPYASGTRLARKALYRAERLSLQHQYEQAERGVTLQQQQAQAALAIAAGQIALAATALEQATEAARIRRDRYRSGKETVSEVLEAEALVRDSASKSELAQIQRARAIIRLRLATGAPLAP